MGVYTLWLLGGRGGVQFLGTPSFNLRVQQSKMKAFSLENQGNKPKKKAV